MLLKAYCETDKSQCYINTDYVVDVFIKDKTYIAYTIDNDRGGYSLSEEEFQRWMDFTNDIEGVVKDGSYTFKFTPDDEEENEEGESIESDDDYDENYSPSKEYYKPMTGFQVLCADDKDEV